jgi:hypothetical protein
MFYSVLKLFSSFFFFKKSDSFDRLETKNKIDLNFFYYHERKNEMFYQFISAPFIKYIYNTWFFIMYLLLFSYVLLCDFYPIKGTSIKEPEIVVIIWTHLLLCEKIHQFAQIESKLLSTRFTLFFSDYWNIIESIAIVLFMIGMTLRLINNCPNCYIAGRAVLSIDIIFWFINSLHAYAMLEEVGPKLIMIRAMSLELLYFIVFILLFIFSFGISTQGLMYHNINFSDKTLMNIFFPPYFVLGGEYYTRETIMGAGTCEIEDVNRTVTDRYSLNDCPDEKGADVTLAMYVLYILFQNILIINLLIAIFRFC